MECYACSASVTEQDRLCPECSHPLPTSQPSPEILEGFDIEAFRTLRDTKTQLHRDLEGMLEEVGDRELDNVERARWTDIYGRWKSARDTMTEEMQRFAPRATERRQGPIRTLQRRSGAGAEGVERREDGDDRRQGDRRAGDRRNPFTDAGE